MRGQGAAGAYNYSAWNEAHYGAEDRMREKLAAARVKQAQQNPRRVRHPAILGLQFALGCVVTYTVVQQAYVVSRGPSVGPSGRAN